MTLSESVSNSFALRLPLKSEVKDLFAWFLCYIPCSLLPLWVSAIVVSLYTKNGFALLDFTAKGEFVLLAASLLGSVFFLLFRDSPPFRFPGRWLLAPAGVALAFVCTAIFVGGLLAAQATNAANATNSTSFLITSPKLVALWSFVAYALSFILLILTMMIDQQSRTISPQKAEQDRLDLLSAEFKKLGDN